jgi:hypothetical protein
MQTMQTAGVIMCTLIPVTRKGKRKICFRLKTVRSDNKCNLNTPAILLTLVEG